jgi:hypothetical protein
MVEWRAEAVDGSQIWQLRPACRPPHGGIHVIALSRARGRRLDWQLQAREGKPHGPCQTPRYCEKELTLKPARRTIAHLDIEVHDEVGGGRLHRRIEGAFVDELNAAAAEYRRKRQSSPELRAALAPVAAALADEIEAWLGEEPEARRDVAVTARLRGGKAQWAYTPWRCVRGEWRKGRSWTVQVDDERDQPVAVAGHPYPIDVAAQVLLSQLGSFVAAVDVVEPQPPPQGTPILHS